MRSFSSIYNKPMSWVNDIVDRFFFFSQKCWSELCSALVCTICIAIVDSHRCPQTQFLSSMEDCRAAGKAFFCKGLFLWNAFPCQGLK